MYVFDMQQLYEINVKQYYTSYQGCMQPYDIPLFIIEYLMLKMNYVSKFFFNILLKKSTFY